MLRAMEWMSVDSSVFEAAAYRPGARQLYLRFGDGDVYRYFDCPVSVYRAFLKAESKGRYFGEHIRNQFKTNWFTARTFAATGMRIWNNS